MGLRRYVCNLRRNPYLYTYFYTPHLNIKSIQARGVSDTRRPMEKNESLHRRMLARSVR